MLILFLDMLDNEPDRRLFEHIYKEHRKQMFSYAYSILNSPEDAEDIVHDVFVRIAVKYMDTVKEIHNKEDMKNYLLRATKNTALNHLKKKRHIHFSLDKVTECDLGNYKELSDNEFLEYLCKRMDYDQVLSVMTKLSETYRDVLYFHFALDLPVPKVAELLDRKTATVKKQLVRGKKMLLALLDSKGDEK